MRASVDLPQPDSPTTASVRAGVDGEGHAAHGLQVRRLAQQAAADLVDLRAGRALRRPAAVPDAAAGAVAIGGAHAAGLAQLPVACERRVAVGIAQRIVAAHVRRPAHGRSSGRSRHECAVA